ncbi:Na+/H+ antiporter subunit D [Microbulbifer sp. 2205BS26-8]|uniref:Na+/H+ antiporter subunit D n=1 Tax=Microbulbifer sp. 2205BS26-8 TaxID=3064386 RepID=UPI00273E8E23|nr:Na+/H+ antiporter subunit D [Microbulbifer sp. 2205BS26-8]MDP5209770.1 Na+/H+ antiporter subunit D [Microbulbifer sp. 2205BS26-8]
MSWLLALPFLIPIGTALATFSARARHHLCGALSVLGCTMMLIVAIAIIALVEKNGPLAAQMGDWDAPFGITLVADRLSAIMLLISAIVGLCVSLFALSDIDKYRVSLGFHCFFQLLLAGVCGSFVTGDLFNLYVWFEVMLIASFTLLVLGGERIQLDGGIKYVALNLISTLLMLTSIGLIYGLTGTLNMAQLHIALAAVNNPVAISALAVLFIAAFGIKAAIFPLFFWLPASYHTPPVAVTAVFAGLLTKVGVYTLIRTFTLIFPNDPGFTHNILLGTALLTMLTGVLGAAAQYEFRKILAFHIISQIGFLILGLALNSPLALAGSVFYIIHNIVAKTNLFLISGTVQRLSGSFELSEIGGIYKASPLLSTFFFIAAFSLSGFPPLSGFWAKLLLLKASLDQTAYLVAAVILITGALTLYSMSKIWAEVFWKPDPMGYCSNLYTLSLPERLQRLLPVAFLAMVTLSLGLLPEPLINYALATASELLEPGDYLDAVLKPEPTQSIGNP